MIPFLIEIRALSLSLSVTHYKREKSHSFTRTPSLSTMAMATIGISQVSSSKNLISSNRSAKSSSTLLRFANAGLSSSSSQLSGGKLVSKAVFRRSCCPSRGRAPILVLPKAVSDSRNSQTCLDPDASAVSLNFYTLLIKEMDWFLLILG